MRALLRTARRLVRKRMSANAQLRTFAAYETIGFMRIAPLLATMLLAACGVAEDPQQAAMMDVIEQQVRMPKEASPLSGYSRFYTTVDTGEIIGTYVASAHSGLPVGQRRWVKDIYHLPAIDDGECFIVNVTFDPKVRKVTQAFCNGIA